MPSISLIAKSIASLSALGAGGTACYHYKDQISEMWNRKMVDYIVESTSDIEDFSSSFRCLSTLKMKIKLASSSKEKNEEEEETQTRKEAYCALKEIKVEAKNNFIDLKKLLNNRLLDFPYVEKNTSLKKNTNFYKLSMDSSKLIALVDDIVELKQEKSDDPVRLKIISALETKKGVVSDNLLILAKGIKAATATDTITSSDSKCKLSDTSTTELKCSIYKLKTDNKKIKDIDFSATTLISDVNQIKESVFYLINFSSSSEDNKKLLQQNKNLTSIILLKDKSTEETKKSTLSFVASIAGKFDKTNNKDHLLYLLQYIDQEETEKESEE